MPKILNPKVVVSTNPEDPNPYKKGTSKHKLMAWALEQQTFTKEQFLAAHKDMGLESVMTVEVAGKAWWNEFFNKHKVFVLAK